MIKARPKYPTDLYSTIYIDNIQKAVVICLIIPTIFPFDAGSSIKNTRMYDIRCTPWILKFERKITQVEAFYGACHRIFNPCKFNLHSKMICILNLFVRAILQCGFSLVLYFSMDSWLIMDFSKTDFK